MFQFISPYQLASMPWLLILVALFLVIVGAVVYGLIRWSQVQDRRMDFSDKHKKA